MCIHVFNVNCLCISEARYGCGDRCVREERAGQKGVLGIVCRDGGADAGTGCGSGDSSAGCNGYDGDGGVSDRPDGSYPVTGCAGLRFMSAHRGTHIPADLPFPQNRMTDDQ